MVPIELSDEARDLVDTECTKFGFSRKAVVESLVKWYASQEDVVRASIMGSIPESMRVDVARMALERMAKAGKGKGASSN